MTEAITPKVDFRRELAGLFDLAGQVAFIPGGYGGIGAAIAWGLAMHGATVVVTGPGEPLHCQVVVEVFALRVEVQLQPLR